MGIAAGAAQASCCVALSLPFACGGGATFDFGARSPLFLRFGFPLLRDFCDCDGAEVTCRAEPGMPCLMPLSEPAMSETVTADFVRVWYAMSSSCTQEQPDVSDLRDAVLSEEGARTSSSGSISSCASTVDVRVSILSAPPGSASLVASANVSAIGIAAPIAWMWSVCAPRELNACTARRTYPLSPSLELRVTKSDSIPLEPSAECERSLLFPPTREPESVELAAARLSASVESTTLSLRSDPSCLWRFLIGSARPSGAFDACSLAMTSPRSPSSSAGGAAVTCSSPLSSLARLRRVDLATCETPALALVLASEEAGVARGEGAARFIELLAAAERAGTNRLFDR